MYACCLFCLGGLAITAIASTEAGATSTKLNVFSHLPPSYAPKQHGGIAAKRNTK